MWNKRGGFADPWPTPMIPPKPFDFNCESVIVETLSPIEAPPASFTASLIIAQNEAGVRWLGGVLIKSRTRFVYFEKLPEHGDRLTSLLSHERVKSR